MTTKTITPMQLVRQARAKLVAMSRANPDLDDDVGEAVTEAMNLLSDALEKAEPNVPPTQEEIESAFDVKLIGCPSGWYVDPGEGHEARFVGYSLTAAMETLTAEHVAADLDVDTSDDDDDADLGPLSQDGDGSRRPC